MAATGDAMTYAPFHNSESFASLPGLVQATFIASKTVFMSRLEGTYLYAYFLTDDLRGDNTIRACLETTNFALFSERDRLYGGSYCSFCHISQVNILTQLIFISMCVNQLYCIKKHRT